MRIGLQRTSCEYWKENTRYWRAETRFEEAGERRSQIIPCIASCFPSTLRTPVCDTCLDHSIWWPPLCWQTCGQWGPAWLSDSLQQKRTPQRSETKKNHQPHQDPNSKYIRYFNNNSYFMWCITVCYFVQTNYLCLTTVKSRVSFCIE